MSETRVPRFSLSLERGLAILANYTRDEPLLGVAEIAERVGLGRSTAHRYVSTLAHLGYLEQDTATRKYRLGLRVMDLGFSVLNSMTLRDAALPYMRRLTQETALTTSLAVRDGLDVIYLERVRARISESMEVDLDLQIGTRLPAYCTSMGKVLLAAVDDSQLDVLLPRVRFEARAERSPSNVEDLRSRLEEVRRAGLAVANEELAFGIRSIAAPVRGANGEVVASISLAVHQQLQTSADIERRLRDPIVRTAAQISRRLGDVG